MIEMNEIVEYIKPELLILIPAMNILGYIIKKSEITDKYIPLILMSVSILLSMIYLLSTSDLSTVQAVVYAVFAAVTQGILASGTAVGANQLVKQLKE